MHRPLLKFVLSLPVLFLSLPAFAQGQARDWQLGFQEPASPVKSMLYDFHDLLLIIITAICVFVLGLLIYASWRYRAKKNQTPSKTTHNTLIEIIWTAVPVLILIVIAIPSFRSLYYMNTTPEAEFTIKAIGYQWYWGYEYPDHQGMAFDSYMIPEKDLKPDQVRLLSVDNPVVVPVDTNIRLIVTAMDVLHSFAVPALGVKTDAIPGRLNETWFRAEKEGVYYGQCSEICGTGHGYMPIEIRAVSRLEFEQWLENAKLKFGVNEVSTPASAQQEE